MALWKRGRRYWTQVIDQRRPNCGDHCARQDSTRATTNWQEAIRLEKELIRAALEGKLDAASALRQAVRRHVTTTWRRRRPQPTRSAPIEFDRERLEIVKRHPGRREAVGHHARGASRASRPSGDSRAPATARSTWTSERCVSVLKRFKQWRRLEDDVKMLTESGGAPIGRALTAEEQERLFEAAPRQSGMGARLLRRRARGQHVDARCRDQARAPEGHRSRREGAAHSKEQERGKQASTSPE